MVGKVFSISILVLFIYL